MTIAYQQDFAELLSACGAPNGADTQDSPVFAEPWHAEAVATTLTLSRNGLFNWNEWVDCFSAHIAAEPQREGEDANAAYYRQWLSALEDILAQKQIIGQEQIAQTKEDWRRSYLNTEHGKPVDFRRGLPEPHVHDDDDDHHHHDDHHHSSGKPQPISISPAVR